MLNILKKQPRRNIWRKRLRATTSTAKQKTLRKVKLLADFQRSGVIIRSKHKVFIKTT